MGVRRVLAAIRIEPSRAIFVCLTVIALFGTTFWLGMRAGVERNTAYRLTAAAVEAIEHSLTVTVGELSARLRARPDHYLQFSRYWGSGVTVNAASNDERDLILLSGFFHQSNELRLIRRNGDVVARWPVRFFDLFPKPDYFPAGLEPASEWNIDLHGALALPDGSVVFNFEYGGLVKLDRCGSVVWTVRRRTHHAVERAEGGGFWVPGRRPVDGPSPYPPFQTPFQDDTVMKVSDDGRVVEEYPVAKLFYENQLESILTAVGSVYQHDTPWGREIVHLNKITELTSDLAGGFPMFEAGDLALSLRDRNLLIVVDKQVTKVKWWKTGPWLRQHDPEFERGGKIVLFNNNLYYTAFAEDTYRILPDIPRVTNIMEIDPASNRSTVIYGAKPGQELLSVIRGKVDITPRGGLFITEAQGGRVRETAADGTLVWEYVNRYDEDEVAELGEARLYPSGYFTVTDWTCP